MKKLLITGGTRFVSRYIAEYYVAKGFDVYVINRNTREQPKGVTLIQADRHDLKELLRPFHFDIVIDTGYTSEDVNQLLNALGSYDDYIFISSSAVYPEYCTQPFIEETILGVNKYWGKYGTDKIEAEQALLKREPNAFILRPPYLYGQMNNVYREAFVFDCAILDRAFYLPNEGEMKLQFLHVNDLCRFIDRLLKLKPTQRIYNIGNVNPVSIREWVEMCYKIVGKDVRLINVDSNIEQRKYFSFYNYEYYLDVSKQYELMNDMKSLYEGLEESYEWYKRNRNTNQVGKKPYIDYIDNNLINVI